MRIEELDYNLPEELIAQEPLARRDEARLLVLHRKDGDLEHSRFYKLARHLNEGDLLVLNDTRVMPARLFVRKESGGRVEVLFVRPMTERPGSWQAMIRAHRPLKEGTRLILDDGHALEVLGYARPGRAIVASENSVPLDELIRKNGMLALPHYINREVNAADREDYQTVYAAHEGAIAAPTAGLHFTDQVFQTLAEAGVRCAFVTLHIGPGTFAPLRSDLVEQHSMEAECYVIPPDTVRGDCARQAHRRPRHRGGHQQRSHPRIVCGNRRHRRLYRAVHLSRIPLETRRCDDHQFPHAANHRAGAGDGAGGPRQILAAYREAIRHRYRFLSYGDAMLII